MKDTYETVEVLLSTVGMTYGLANIDEVLGIILLVINLLQFGIRIGVEIYNLIKGKSSPQDLIDTLEGVEDRVEDMLEDVKEKEGDVNVESTDQR